MYQQLSRLAAEPSVSDGGSSGSSNEEEPTPEEIREYAISIGIDPDKEPELMWIAETGIVAPLPSDDWDTLEDNNGAMYFFNYKTGETLWDHPSDQKFRQLVTKERQILNRKKTTSSNVATSNSNQTFNTKQDRPKSAIGAKVTPAAPLSATKTASKAPLGPLAAPAAAPVVPKATGRLAPLAPISSSRGAGTSVVDKPKPPKLGALTTGFGKSADAAKVSSTFNEISKPLERPKTSHGGRNMPQTVHTEHAAAYPMLDSITSPDTDIVRIIVQASTEFNFSARTNCLQPNPLKTVREKPAEEAKSDGEPDDSFLQELGLLDVGDLEPAVTKGDKKEPASPPSSNWFMKTSASSDRNHEVTPSHTQSPNGKIPPPKNIERRNSTNEQQKTASIEERNIAEILNFEHPEQSNVHIVVTDDEKTTDPNESNSKDQTAINEKKRQEEIERHRAQLQSLKREFDAERNKLEREHAAELSTVKQKYQTEIKEAMEAMRRSHQETIDAEVKLHERKLNQLRDNHESEQKRLMLTQQQQLRHLREDHEKALEKMEWEQTAKLRQQTSEEAKSMETRYTQTVQPAVVPTTTPAVQKTCANNMESTEKIMTQLSKLESQLHELREKVDQLQEKQQTSSETPWTSGKQSVVTSPMPPKSTRRRHSSASTVIERADQVLSEAAGKQTAPKSDAVEQSDGFHNELTSSVITVADESKEDTGSAAVKGSVFEWLSLTNKPPNIDQLIDNKWNQFITDPTFHPYLFGRSSEDSKASNISSTADLNAQLADIKLWLQNAQNKHAFRI